LALAEILQLSDVFNNWVRFTHGGQIPWRSPDNLLRARRWCL